MRHCVMVILFEWQVVISTQSVETQNFASLPPKTTPPKTTLPKQQNMSGNKKFQNKYRIQSARLADWDYGSNATYFITICTHGRLHYFGEISRVLSGVETQHFASLRSPNITQTQHFASLRSPNILQTQNFASLPQNTMNLSQLGMQAHKCAIEIPEHFPFVIMDTFIVMPNHVHLLFTICKPDDMINDDDDNNGNNDENGSNDSNEPNVETQNFASLQPYTKKSPSKPMNQFGPQSKNVASVIRGFKIGVTNFAHVETQDFASLQKFQWQARFHDHIVRDEEEYFRIRDYINDNVNRWNEDTLNNEK